MLKRSGWSMRLASVRRMRESMCPGQHIRQAKAVRSVHGATGNAHKLTMRSDQAPTLWLRSALLSLAVAAVLTVLWFATASLDAAFAGIDLLGILFFSVAVIEPLLCILAARTTRGHEQQAWSTMALAGVLMGITHLAASVVAGELAVPIAAGGPAIRFWWAMGLVLLMLGSLRFFDSTYVHWSMSVHRVIDFLVALLFIALSAFSVFIVFVADGHAGSVFELGSVLAMLSFVVPGSLLAFVLTSRPRMRSWHVLFMVTVGVVTVVNTVRAIMYVGAGSIAPEARLVTLPWFLVGSMLAIAALLRLKARTLVSDNDLIPYTPLSIKWGTVMTGLVFVSLPVFMTVVFDYIDPGPGRIGVTFAAALLGMVAIGRNLSVALENSSLHRRSATDPLTGLYNHRFFQDRLGIEVQRAVREKTPLSVVIFDLDDFDRVNNVYGHSVGDTCLREVAECMDSESRAIDVLCRVGGDEFAMIMPETEPLEAYKVCLRMQAAIHEREVAPTPVGLSAGVAAMPMHASTREELVSRADGALYWAKFHGREQVVIFDPELVRALGPEQRIEMLEEEAYLNMVQMLASAVDARDSYTQRHSRSVAELAVDLAHQVGLETTRVRDIEIAALLHDVGKIGITDAVLGKTSALDEHERSHIQEHPELAVRILNAIPRQEILPWIGAHHEHWDGGGYPHGLAGEDIPLESRIIALCDAFDAMTSDRPYRSARTPAEALAQIEACAGTQFDPQLAAMFVEMLQKKGDTGGAGSVTLRVSGHSSRLQPAKDQTRG